MKKLPLSVVIITRNEARNIVSSIRSAGTISDDIIVVDARSSDDTALLAMLENARVISQPWYGFGFARNMGAAAARYDWIFSLDADELLTTGFAASLRQGFRPDPSCCYRFRCRTFQGGRRLRFGRAGSQKIVRLYNRHTMKWDRAPAGEKLTGSAAVKDLPLAICHYPRYSTEQRRLEYRQRAYLCALKLMRDGKGAGTLKAGLAVLAVFVFSYILLLGFLDGREGLSAAWSEAGFVRLKYRYLHWLNTTRHPVLSLPGVPASRLRSDLPRSSF